MQSATQQKQEAEVCSLYRTSTLQVLVSGSHNSLCSIAAQQVRTKFNDAQRQEKLTKFRLVWPLILPRLWRLW